MIEKLAVVGGDKLYRGYGSGNKIIFQEAIGYLACLEDQGIISDLKYGDYSGKGGILLEETNKKGFEKLDFSSVFGKDEKLRKFILDNQPNTHIPSDHLALNLTLSRDFTVWLPNFEKRFPHLETFAYFSNLKD